MLPIYANSMLCQVGKDIGLRFSAHLTGRLLPEYGEKLIEFCLYPVCLFLVHIASGGPSGSSFLRGPKTI